MDAILEFQRQVSAPVLEVLGAWGPWLLLAIATAGGLWVAFGRHPAIAEAEAQEDDEDRPSGDDEWGTG